MTQQDSLSDDVIIEDGDWQLRHADSWWTGINKWNSVIRHQCGKEHHQYSTYAPFRSTNCHCGWSIKNRIKSEPPEYMVGLWYLHNFDLIGEKR